MSNIYEIAMRLHLCKWFHGTPVADATLAADLKAMRDALAVEAVTGPSDAEISALAAQHLCVLSNHQMQAGDSAEVDGEITFARAVLARWGSPPVAAPADALHGAIMNLPTAKLFADADPEYQRGYKHGHRDARHAAAALAAATPAAVAHDGAAEVAEPTYLCQAWGETDFPAAALVKGLAAVRQFLIEQWLGSADHEHDDGTNALEDAMKDMQEQWEMEGDAWKWSVDFEIGGVSVQQVADFSPADRAQRPAAPAAVAPVADKVCHAMVRAAMYADVVAGAVSTPGMKEQAAEDAATIRAALASAQGEAAQPVAWMRAGAGRYCGYETCRKTDSNAFPVYRATPQPAPVAKHATTDGPAPAQEDAAHGPMTSALEVGSSYWFIRYVGTPHVGFDEDVWRAGEWDRRRLAERRMFRTEADARAALQAEKGGE